MNIFDHQSNNQAAPDQKESDWIMNCHGLEMPERETLLMICALSRVDNPIVINLRIIGYTDDNRAMVKVYAPSATQINHGPLGFFQMINCAAGSQGREIRLDRVVDRTFSRTVMELAGRRIAVGRGIETLRRRLLTLILITKVKGGQIGMGQAVMIIARQNLWCDRMDMDVIRQIQLTITDCEDYINPNKYLEGFDHEQFMDARSFAYKIGNLMQLMTGHDLSGWDISPKPGWSRDHLNEEAEGDDRIHCYCRMLLRIISKQYLDPTVASTDFNIPKILFPNFAVKIQQLIRDEIIGGPFVRLRQLSHGCYPDHRADLMGFPIGEPASEIAVQVQIAAITGMQEAQKIIDSEYAEIDRINREWRRARRDANLVGEIGGTAAIPTGYGAQGAAYDRLRDQREEEVVSTDTEDREAEGRPVEADRLNMTDQANDLVAEAHVQQVINLTPDGEQVSDDHMMELRITVHHIYPLESPEQIDNRIDGMMRALRT